MYAGNIGYAQDWNTLIDVAKQVSDVNVFFLCNWRRRNEKLALLRNRKKQVRKH